MPLSQQLETPGADLTAVHDARSRLPEFLRPLFWEYEFDEIRLPGDRAAVTYRILARGGLAHTTWLIDTVGPSAIREHLQRTGGRGLDARTLRYWQALLELPDSVVDTWLEDPGRALWDAR